ncbi:MAG: EthD family reductase [Acetobacteraceae bacterium]
MIKVLSLLTRKPGLSHEQFVKHWREIHGPLALGVPGLRRYVQSHITATRTRADIAESEFEIDGIAELWYDDEAALRASAATEEAKRLYADGALFIGRIKTFVIDEQEIIPRRG